MFQAAQDLCDRLQVWEIENLIEIIFCFFNAEFTQWLSGPVCEIEQFEIEFGCKSIEWKLVERMVISNETIAPFAIDLIIVDLFFLLNFIFLTAWNYIFVLIDELGVVFV